MSSNTLVVKTRISAPRRRKELVTRPELNHILTEMAEKRLVLVSAPAGYGKTSLLVDFCSSFPAPVCWYSIDRLDFDPSRFISYFVAAIQHQFPEFGKRTLAAISENQSQVNVDYVATVLVNDLIDHVREHFLFVLDDFHLVTDSVPVKNFIGKFLELVDENCHLVITSRILLGLPVLRVLASRAEVGGISYEELAFNSADIQQMYQQNHDQDISFEAAEEIRKRTEGWVTGIILASQVNQNLTAARARLARVSGFGLDEYFLQIIDHLPEDLRKFLLWTSLLEEFNLQRCDDILGPALHVDPALTRQWIQSVQQNNLFVLPVGEQGDWLRYHPLFLEFLQAKARKELPEDTRQIEIQLASASCEWQDWDRAFAIYHRMNATDELTNLIEIASPDLIAGGRMATLSAWLDSLPGEVLNSRPFVVALQGYVAMALGTPDLALTLYNQSIAAMVLPQDKVFLARTLAMRATQLRIKGQLKEAIRDATECMGLIEDDLELRKIRGDALRMIGLCNFHQGDLKKALHHLHQALLVMQSIKDYKNEAIIHLEMGAVYENLGQYSDSMSEYESALNYWKLVENPIWLSNLLNNLGVIQQMTGEYEQAIQSFEQAYQYAHHNSYVRMEAFVLTGIGDIYAELQAYDQSNQAYELAGEKANAAQEHFLQVYIKVQQAALAGVRGDLAAGYDLIQSARKMLTSDSSEMEHRLCELEYAGLKILEHDFAGVIPLLEEVRQYFSKAGHKVQLERTNLYMLLAYQALEKPEKVLEYQVYLTAGVSGQYLPAALIAVSARFHKQLVKGHLGLMQDGMSTLFGQVESFLKRLPVLRKYLREHARAVPFAPATLVVRALGRMQVQTGIHTVTSSEWQTQAARDMFFLLLAHPEGMTKEEISLIFWPDATIEEAKFRFKNTIYRLRHALGKECILLCQDIYRFNNSMDYEYDVEVFLKESAEGGKAQEPLQKLAHYREALKYYRGTYLPEIEETWVYTPRENLAQTYLNIVLQASQIYYDQANYDIALDFCQRALNHDNLLEDAHRMALRIYAAMGNRAGIVRQYQRCVEIFEREIQSEPSPQTQALYQELLK